MLRLDPTNWTVLDAKYYSTYAYTGSGGIPARGQPPFSMTARRFYTAVAELQDYWSATMLREGTMDLGLPVRGETDGGMLANQGLHGMVRDMISRIGAINVNGTYVAFFPQYGVQGVSGAGAR